MKAIEEEGLTAASIATENDFDESLPWDVINCGVSKNSAARMEKRCRAETTP